MARVRRVLVLLAVAVIGVMLASLLAVHTPWARGRALAWASQFVTRYQLVLQAGSLGYNALTRRVTLTDVRLAAKGFESRPFLVASRIEVRLPWMVYRGRFAIDHLEISGGIVDIHRDENGTVNLPPGSNRPTPETPRRLNIGGFTLRGLDVHYTDAARNWGIQVPRIEAALEPRTSGSTGNFAVRGNLAVRLRDRTMTMEPFETVMTFDGSNVLLEQARLSSPEIDAFLAGTIARVLDSPSLDLTIKGTVNFEPAMQWVPPPPVPIAATATIDGVIKGPARDFTTDLRVTSNTLAIGRSRNNGLSGPVRVTFDAFSGEDLLITPQSGGEIRASFNVPWGRGSASTARASWKRLDSSEALDLANIEPQNIAAMFDGEGRFDFGQPRRFTITNRSTGIDRRGAVPMSGTITATIVADDYSYDHDHLFPGFAFSGQMRGRINRDAAAATTMSGPAHARISDVARTAASVETLGLPIAAILHEVHGALDAPMTLGGTYRAPEITTEVSGDAIVLPLLGEVRASARVEADPRRADISAIDIRRGSSAITGDVTADITQRRWSGTLRVTSGNVAELQAEVPEAWRVTGPVSADAALGGTFDEFQLDTAIKGRDLVWAGQTIDRVEAKAMVTADAIDVSSLQVFQGPGYLDGRVRYAWDSGAYDATLKGDRLTWRGSVLSPDDTQAIFAVQFTGAGTVDAPKGTVRLDFSLSGGDAGTLIGAGDATAELDGNQARVVAHLPSIGALVNADISTRSPYDYRATAALDRFELAKLSPFIGAVENEILGFATGTVTASGRLADDRDRVAFVNITELDAGIGGVPVSLLAPLNVTLRGEDLELRELFMRVGSGRLSASGKWNTKLDGEFRAQYAGGFQDVIRAGRAFGVPATFDGSGPLTVDLTSNGSRLGTKGTLSIQNGTFNWGGGPHAVQALDLEAALDGESLTLSRLSGNVASGGVVGSFSATGAAKLPELTLSAITGAIVVDTAAFTFSGIPVAQQRPTRLEFASGTLRVAEATWTIAENPVVLGGLVGIAAEDPPLNLSVKGLVDLRVLSAFVRTVAFDGTADLDAFVAGTASAPRFDGKIVLSDADIAIAEPRLLLSELDGTIVLDGQRAIVDSVQGLANGGALLVDGTVEFADMTLSGGALNIQVQGLALELPQGLRSELDALITFQPDPKAPSLTGDIRVVQSAYTAPITIAALARQAAAPVSPVGAERPYLERLRLNLTVSTTEDLTIDNNYGRLAAGGTVRLVGTVAEPGMDGRIALREGGQIYLAGRTFRITRGDVSFTDRRRIAPEFDIAAEARLGGENITMTLTGTLERPTIDLTSDESGRTPGEIAATLVGSSNAETALTILSADLLGVTGRAIGLDAFRVERGDFEDADFRNYREDPSLISANRTDPTTRLTVSKRLSEQVEFTVSQNLREDGQATFVISYFPRHNLEIRGISRDDDTVSLGVRHQLTFGAGVARAPSERRVRPVVSEVRFIDVAPAIEAEVRRQISLDPGDEFDFLVLQRDVDRIQEEFHRQGFWEARVRTRRLEAEDARSVIVEYRVERGPRTSLEFSGFVPDAELTAELEQAWHRNAFDQFLVEDLTHRVRRHLVESGDLASIVVGVVDRPSPDAKRLRIEVTPGVPVTGREIRFLGNRHLDAEQLRGEIAAAGLEIEAWLDRTPVERLLRQVYAEEGFRAATVAGQPLDVEGTTGVLAFEIDEGPQSQIRDIRWAGVAAERLPAIQKAAALETPTAFIAADITAARRRVEDEYRRRGFNAAEIDVVPTAVDETSMALTFDIEEGARQVLQEVEFTGVEVTNAKVLRQALRFELGAPVDLDAWALARKRLYDTNVFRVVDIQPNPLGEAVNGVQPVKAVVAVEEYPQWAFRYGVQLEAERNLELDEFTSSRNLGVVGELKNSNLFGRALTLGLFGMYQYDRRDASVFLATSRLFGWRARSSLYGYVSHDRIRDEPGAEIAAINDIQGISADQRWRRRSFEIVYGYTFERNHTYDPDPGNEILPLDFIANLSKLTSAALFDRRDDPINAKRGTFSSIALEHSASWLGSDVDNRKLLMQQYVFVPMGQLVLASRVISGFAFGTDDLLLSDRFQAGGATSVRGYGEDSLGPRNIFGVPAGGEKLLVLNQEARFPVYRWAHAVGFIDAGNIFGEDDAVSLQNLKVGIGFGLRLDTPVGLLRADVGFPRSTLPTTETKKVRFYFGFGQIF